MTDHLYLIITEDFNRDLDSYFELAQSEVRFRINNILAHGIPEFDSDSIRNNIKDIVHQIENIKFLDSDVMPDCNYIPFLSIAELEDIYRQEIEYFVIRKKMPIWLFTEDNRFIKLKLGYDPSCGDEPVPLMKFSYFRDMEHSIHRTFKSVSRVRISESRFKNEKNLVVVYSIITEIFY